MQRALWPTAFLVVGSHLVAACDGGGTGVPRAASMEAVSALQQEAAVGKPVTEAPTVRVLDAGGRPVPGMGVTFAVPTGNGSVEVMLATTDQAGVATAGQWTLGPAVGLNIVSARVGGLSNVVFVANGRDPCALLTPYTPFETVQGTLFSLSCDLFDGVYGDLYSVVTDGGGLTFSMSSTAVAPLLLLANDHGRVFALGGAPEGQESPARMRVLLPGDDYILAASTQHPGQTGGYTLQSSFLEGNVDCQETWTAVWHYLRQEITASDCDYGGFLTDDYLVVLRATEGLTITMSSDALDSYVRVWGENGVVAEAAGEEMAGGLVVASLRFGTAATSVYLIEAGSATPGQTGRYSLELRASPPTGAGSVQDLPSLTRADAQRVLRTRIGRGAGAAPPQRR